MPSSMRADKFTVYAIRNAHMYTACCIRTTDKYVVPSKKLTSMYHQICWQVCTTKFADEYVPSILLTSMYNQICWHVRPHIYSFTNLISEFYSVRKYRDSRIQELYVSHSSSGLKYIMCGKVEVNHWCWLGRECSK